MTNTTARITPASRFSLLDGTGGSWVQPNPEVDEWVSVESAIWSSIVGPLPRKTIESEWGVVAEVLEP